MNENEGISLIDSNVLVHAYNRADARKHVAAVNLLEKCWQRQVVYAVSIQNLAEFFVVVTKKVPSPLSIENAEKIIADICAFSHWRVLRSDEKTLQQAISLYKEFKGHFWDVLIAATMIDSGISHIYSENTDDFNRINGIRAKNPFISP